MCTCVSDKGLCTQLNCSALCELFGGGFFFFFFFFVWCRHLQKLEASQRAMERKMLNVKLKDRIRNTIIRQ